jgi:hypothetical protein
LLAIIERFDERLDPAKYSIYSYIRVKELWAEGNPFAWHLFSESRLIFSSDDTDFLSQLGKPEPYSKVQADCSKFQALFEESVVALCSGSPSPVFELSSVFLAIRNFATCFALGGLGLREFSRHSASKLNGFSIRIDCEVLDTLQKCRVLSTRGIGELPRSSEITNVVDAVPIIRDWMNAIMKQLK